jgi:hypothetical protein
VPSDHNFAAFTPLSIFEQFWAFWGHVIAYWSFNAHGAALAGMGSHGARLLEVEYKVENLGPSDHLPKGRTCTITNFWLGKILPTK